MDQKTEIADRLHQANNILVTVSNNPSVDQLSACIGLTLALNKMGKHATAVFSGMVPNTIEFLQPEKTIEKNTDSLRDFIIALDKSKADKLRYKVEDKVVKIFITPYKTSISDKDLNFSQGDFNVDVVIALGVHNQVDLDQAITSHGRILHDAAVATINVKPGGELGTMNWLDTTASSLCELVVSLIDAVDKTLMDAQMATAFLTGIVAETKRFSNEKTSPTTMSISAELMVAGADQQLVATKLEPPAPPPLARAAAPAETPVSSETPYEAAVPKADDGTLEISHGESAFQSAPRAPEPPAPAEPPKSEEPEGEPEAQQMSQIHIDEHGSLRTLEEEKEAADSVDPTHHMETQHMILQPPTLGGQLTANTSSEDPEQSSDPLSLPSPDPDDVAILGGSAQFGAPQPPKIMTHDAPIVETPTPTPPPIMPTPAPMALPPLPPPAPMPPAPAPMPAPVAQPAAPTVSEPVIPSPPTIAPMLPPLPPEPVAAMPTPAPVSMPTPSFPPSNQTLSAIEAEVHSPHLAQGLGTPGVVDIAPPPIMPTPAPMAEPPALPPLPPPTPPVPDEPSHDESLASARDAVMQAIAGQPTSDQGPIQALNAQPLGDVLHPTDPTMVSPSIVTPSSGLPTSADPSFSSLTQPSTDQSAPPVPPPMMPPTQY